MVVVVVVVVIVCVVWQPFSPLAYSFSCLAVAEMIGLAVMHVITSW